MSTISLHPVISLINDKIAAFDRYITHWQTSTLSTKAQDFIQLRRDKLLELRYTLLMFESVLQKKEESHKKDVTEIANALLEFVPQLIENKPLTEAYQARTQDHIKKLIGINFQAASETTRGDLTVIGPVLSFQATMYILFRALVLKHPISDLRQEFMLLAAGLGISITAAFALWKKRQTGEISDAATYQISLISLFKDPQLTQALSLSVGITTSLIEVMGCPALLMQRRFPPAPADGVPPHQDLKKPEKEEIAYDFLKPPRLLRPSAASPNQVIPALQL